MVNRSLKRDEEERKIASFDKITCGIVGDNATTDGNDEYIQKNVPDVE